MAKKALCVGINDYPAEDNDLNGCVGDAKAWASVLREQFGFAKTDVKVLLDEQAKKKDYLRELKALLAGAKSGDVLVFANSSHGSYEYTEGDDEDGRFDEGICPYDIDDHLLLDDELRELFANLKAGVRLTVISDSCHSGTVTRAVTESHTPSRAAATRRVRFYSPALRRRSDGSRGVVIAKPWVQSRKKAARYPESGMNEILLSGCRSDQYSYDDWFPEGYHGAMSYYALQTLREANYRVTYAQLHARTKALLTHNEYPQSPQLEGKEAFKRRQVFT